MYAEAKASESEVKGLSLLFLNQKSVATEYKPRPQGELFEIRVNEIQT